MKRKYIIFFMQFFTSLCIVSVGFASWTFVSGDSITATGNIYAEDVYNYEDFIEFDGDIIGFSYCSSGFLTDDLQKTSSGVVKVNLLVNATTCSIQYADCDSLKIQIELKYKQDCDFKMFSSDIDISNKITCSEGIDITNVTEVQDGSYLITFQLNNYLENFRKSGITDTHKDYLNIEISFPLNSTQFTEAYPSFANMDFDCIVKLEGC